MFPLGLNFLVVRSLILATTHQRIIGLFLGKPEIKVENQKVSEAKKAPAKSGVPAKPEPPAKSGTSAKQVKVVDPKEEKDDDSDDESDDELDSSDEEVFGLYCPCLV